MRLGRSRSGCGSSPRSVSPIAAEDVDEVGPGEIVAVLGSIIEAGETITHEASTPPRAGTRQSSCPPLHAPRAAGRRTIDRASDLRACGRSSTRILSLALGTDPGDRTDPARAGELHLEIVIEKLREDHAVAVHASALAVAYRETITRHAEAEVRHIKQKGGSGQFAVVKLSVHPTARGAAFFSATSSVGGSIPSRVRPGDRAWGPRSCGGGDRWSSRGRLKRTLTGGDFHAKDSNEIAFPRRPSSPRARASERRSSEVEPIMTLEVAVTRGLPRGGARGSRVEARPGRVNR